MWGANNGWNNGCGHEGGHDGLTAEVVGFTLSSWVRSDMHMADVLGVGGKYITKEKLW